MPDRPLLIFPTPARVGRYKRPPGFSVPEFVTPQLRRQVARIEPLLNDFERSITDQRTLLRSDVTGVEPEKVLVFETRGSVPDFFKAVRAIPELEWLGEQEEEFLPDELFFYRDHPEKQVKGKFYFVMANQDAMRKILRLWENYRYGRRYDRGTTKWRDLFALLYDVRAWSIMDRVDETGLLQDIAIRKQFEQQIVPFEIELWFRKSANERSIVEQRIQSILNKFNGEIVSKCVVADITYHALLVRGPIQLFDDLSSQTDIEFFKSDDIMYLRPIGQCIIKSVPEEDVIQTDIKDQDAGPLLAPTIALLDGLPLQNHLLLANRLNIDDPDNFSADYLATSRVHGTGMASIIIHGDLKENDTPIKSKLYVRPILKPEQSFRGTIELIPENILTIDLVHRAVRRIFEKEGEQQPAAPSVRIINLSIGDPSRIFDNIMSSWAKLLDWLSFKYKVLFIVSAGNCADDLVYTGGTVAFQNLLQDNHQLASNSINILYDNNRHRKVISPAESINAITVGATDHDASNIAELNPGQRLIFDSPNYLSPLSRIGLGYRRSVKPDVLAPGGRAVYRQDAAGGTILRFANSNREPGIQVASPVGNSTNGSIFFNGTSCSAAYLTHKAAKLHENLIESQLTEELYNSLFAITAKTLLVHSASWDEESAQTIASSIPGFNANSRDLVTRFLGYGTINTDRVIECTEKRVTLIGYGTLGADQAHLFELPVPVELSGSTLWRSLTVTLAWISPVNPQNQAYRQAKLWFDFPDRKLDQILNVSRKFYDNDTVNRGTVQHEIFDGERASAFLEGASLPIRVNCKQDAPQLSVSIDYVLAVTFEVAPQMQIDIYAKLIELFIKQKVAIRQ